MKGDFDELSFAFIEVAIILVVMIWAVDPIYKSIDLAQQNSAKLNAQEIAGIINAMKASQSDQMTYSGFLPPVTCTFEVNERFVKFDISAGGKDQIAVVDIIQTPVKVVSDRLFYECKGRKITIERNGKIIRVS
jgi:hypothetical protein